MRKLQQSSVAVAAAQLFKLCGLGHRISLQHSIHVLISKGSRKAPSKTSILPVQVSQAPAQLVANFKTFYALREYNVKIFILKT